MKFVPPDTCLEDYERRRTAFFEYVRRGGRSRATRVKIISEWLDANSPYDDEERLLNLLLVLYGGEQR